MMYPASYVPCRYVRISCLRGSPIAIFFVQLIGIPVPGLEPEFQPLVNYLLPQITSHKQASHNVHLQLLKDIATRLPPFLPHIEADLASVADTPESSVRFLALLAGPFYPILQLVNERDATKTLISSADSDTVRSSLTSNPTISSNFEAQPRRSRSPSSVQPAFFLLAFRSETALLLLRKAHKDKTLGIVCHRASRILQKLLEPEPLLDESISNGGMCSSQVFDETTQSDASSLIQSTDFYSLCGEESSLLENHFDGSFLNILDIAAVEEGILHVLYAVASQPLLCCKLAEVTSDMWSVLPLVHALLPALRPPLNPGPTEQIDDSFSQWIHPNVQNALSQIVTMSVVSSVLHPLLRACAGYLSSYLPSHAKAACVLLDLCRGPLSPWVLTITAKVDLAIELLENLLGVIQGSSQSLARAALKYVALAISGHMDDLLTEYKEVKHKLLFILEMLDPFIDPSISVMKDRTTFGGVSAMYLEKQAKACDIAINIIHTAAKCPAVLPSLELEWRQGAVAPSVLLSILDPHMPLPPDVDLCKSSVPEIAQVSLAVSNYPEPHSCNPEDVDGRDVSEITVKAENFEQCTSFFAPEELKKSDLTNTLQGKDNDRSRTSTDFNQNIPEGRKSNDKLSGGLFQFDNIVADDYYDAQADYQQLVNHHDCELRSLEFQRLALNLCMQQEPTSEGHNAGIDALLLAAECYVNPFFLLDAQPNSQSMDRIERIHSELTQGNVSVGSKGLLVKDIDLVTIYNLENKRDKAVLDLLLQAARFDCEYQKKITDGELYPDDAEEGKQSIEISQDATRFIDAVTLIRMNQVMLCHFIMKQFRRKGHLSNEILLQSLLFLLHSATDLFCPPEDVIDIILKSAENLNGQLACLYHSVNAGEKKFDRVKVHGLRRRWALLQKLVLASSGNDNTRELVSIKRDGFRFRSLVPPSAWVLKISEFSRFSSPLPRFLGWMAVSRYAKEYIKERLFLVSDFSQLTALLSIFMDDLSLMDDVVTQEFKSANSEEADRNSYSFLRKETQHAGWLSDQPNMRKLFHILLPELHFFFPSMSKLFRAFGENILEAVGLQLKCLPKSALQDILCWFSDMCLWPYLESIKEHLVVTKGVSFLRGNIAANAKAVVFYLLESIVSEHLEGIVPEMTRVVHILVSLCRASYTDVAFLDSVLCLMKPLVSYYLRKRTDDVCSDIEFICFEELFEIIRCGKQPEDTTGDKIQAPLLIFILGSLFPDLSHKRRIEILCSLLVWVDCIGSDPPSLLCSYLHSFQTLIDSCETILVLNIESLGTNILSVRDQSTESANSSSVDAIMHVENNLKDGSEQILMTSTEYVENGGSCKGGDSLPFDCIKEFCDALEKFVHHLTPTIEGSWKWHHQLASRLSLAIAKCVLYAKFLKSIAQENTPSSTEQEVAVNISSELAQKHWESALEGLTEIILADQEKQCWQVASALLDYMIKLPNTLSWGNVLNATCLAIKAFCYHAPRISWRLQTEKWLTLLVSGGIEDLRNSEIPLIDLLCSMLSHAEPEQRSVALQQLGRIISLSSATEVDSKCPTYDRNLLASGSTLTSHLVTHTWDRVAALAFYDPSMLLRKHAMALLTEYVPFVDTYHLRSFLASSNSILNGVGQLSCVIEEGYLTHMSLLLLSRACLYSSPEMIALIPECVWRKLENIQTSITGGFGDMEKDLCRAVCQLRSESDAKRVVKELLSGSTAKPVTTEFNKDLRESVLQVMSTLSSVEAYFEFFSTKSDQEHQELEEAEIELELVEKERAPKVFVGHPNDTVVPAISSYCKSGTEVNKRLQRIREDIQSLERSRLREEIIARRQKKLLFRHTREKFLEETSSREMELMQELDRERALEMEREIERQRQLDLERVKSRELQFNLDMEREKQTQRELQRELEQVELGRSSRRELSANNPNSSRSRERYHRERDTGTGRAAQQQQEGGLRPSSRGGHEEGQAAGPTAVVLVGGSTRPFSSGNHHLPTMILQQSRERATDERYEDSAAAAAEGSRGDSISGEALSSSSIAIGGDAAEAAFVDGGGRHRKSASSRQVVVEQRRERDGRRGESSSKWERKQQHS